MNLYDAVYHVDSEVSVQQIALRVLEIARQDHVQKRETGEVCDIARCGHESEIAGRHQPVIEQQLERSIFMIENVVGKFLFGPDGKLVVNQVIQVGDTLYQTDENGMIVATAPAPTQEAAAPAKSTKKR